MLTHKKLHFKDKNDIKNFFNELRDDFADSLNFNGNLNYHNAYKFEKNNILENIEFTNQKQNRNYYRDTIQLLAKDKESMENKINIFNYKIDKVLGDINKLKEIKRN